MLGVSHTTVGPVLDETVLRNFLERDRVAAAYHLGDLDPRYAGFCRWFGAAGPTGDLDGVLLLYTGLRMPAVLSLGTPDAIEQLLEDESVREQLPRRFYGHIMKPHLGSLHPHYRVDEMRSMLRMGLHRDDFSPPSSVANGVIGIGHPDTAELMELYRYYPDNFFEPYQLDCGYYVGVRKEGALISVAGTHIVSEAADLAVLGNIVTHPQWRSKGYSTRCTLKILRRLFERVSLVALTVRDGNDAARRVYERLGFTAHMKYLEGLVYAR